MYKKIILSTICVMLLPTTTVFGQSDKFTNKEEERLYNSILGRVGDTIDSFKEGSLTFYENTELNSVLTTNFGDKDYPSELDGTNEGMSNGKPVLNALKRPLTEPAHVELAELTRFYYFNFTDGKTFETLGSGVDKLQDISVGVANKLNYFDYVDLIETTYKNPNYTASRRNGLLVDIENELQNSINALYGVTNKTGSLSSWQGAKSVQAPFRTDKYTYLQLLSAYKKDERIVNTLEFYSSIIDAMYAIRNYSINLRQGNTTLREGFNYEYHIKNIYESYTLVERDVVEPVVEILQKRGELNAKLQAGDEWQQASLGELGLTEVK